MVNGDVDNLEAIATLLRTKGRIAKGDQPVAVYFDDDARRNGCVCTRPDVIGAMNSRSIYPVRKGRSHTQMGLMIIILSGLAAIVSRTVGTAVRCFYH